MDSETYDQVTLSNEMVGDDKFYLAPNTQVVVMVHENNPVMVEMPASVTLKVVDTPPGIKGATATNQLKDSFPAQANGTSPIVVHTSKGKLTDQQNAQAINQAASALSKDPDVASVVNPLTSQGASALSKDQQTGYLSVTLAVSPGSTTVVVSICSMSAGPSIRCPGWSFVRW